MSIREYAIATIPADGIGIEMIEATIEVLVALQQRFPEIRLKFEAFDWGSDYYKKHGAMMPRTA